MEYFLCFIEKLHPISSETKINLLKRFICSLTHRSLPIGNKNVIASEKCYQKLFDGTLTCTVEFFQSLLQLVELHHQQLKERIFTDAENTPETDTNSPR